MRLAAALVEMAASLTTPDGSLAVGQVRERAAAIRSAATRLADEDAAAYAGVIEAWRAPREDAGRAARVAGALSRAADVPLAIAEHRPTRPSSPRRSPSTATGICAGTRSPARCWRKPPAWPPLVSWRSTSSPCRATPVPSGP